ASPSAAVAGGDLLERRAWASERVLHWWVVANRAHNATLDDVPTVQFSPRLRHALGWADSRRNLIKISDWHLMDKSQRIADETVAHEVAHIFADRHYGKPCRHGKLWKKTMIAMGQKPDVTFRDTPEDAPDEEAPATSLAPSAAAS
ncbi:MAG: SprT-like domain-containing protein, partial [Phycisphaerales bacterium]|nr:SprT-like domain-containing protein [Phycisphaerales bacterium]